MLTAKGVLLRDPKLSTGVRYLSLPELIPAFSPRAAGPSPCCFSNAVKQWRTRRWKKTRYPWTALRRA